jgi:hypothetical protein
LMEVAAENNQTVVVPLPVDIVTQMFGKADKQTK